MQHTGLLFLSKTRPLAGMASDGAFQLQLFALDRIGPHQVEPWRLLWAGPEAQRFYQQHGSAGPGAGTALRVQCTSARAHQGGRVGAEIVAHIVTCEIALQRTSDVREQLSNQEQSAPVALPAPETSK